jgi:hypothetical protein
MKKVIFSLLITFAISSIVYAQPRIHVGLTTAVNSTFVLDQGLKTDPRYVSQVNTKWAPIGFNFGVDFTNKIGLTFESIKAAQGQIYQIVDMYEQIKGAREIDLKYFQFPLLLRMMGGSNKAARMNFQIGPQLSILDQGVETIQYEASDYMLPEGANLQEGVELPEGISMADLQQNPDGSYSMPEMEPTTILSSAAESEIQKFRDKEVQLAFGFGVDIDVLKHFYISANLRGNYSFTDMRNEQFLDYILDQDVKGIFENRANLLIGLQLGFHWMIGGNRSWRAKMMVSEEGTGR